MLLTTLSDGCFLRNILPNSHHPFLTLSRPRPHPYTITQLYTQALIITVCSVCVYHKWDELFAFILFVWWLSQEKQVQSTVIPALNASNLLRSRDNVCLFPHLIPRTKHDMQNRCPGNVCGFNFVNYQARRIVSSKGSHFSLYNWYMPRFDCFSCSIQHHGIWGFNFCG